MPRKIKNKTKQKPIIIMGCPLTKFEVNTWRSHVTCADASMSEAAGDTDETLVAIGGTIGGVAFVAMGTLLVCVVVRGWVGNDSTTRVSQCIK